MKTEMKYEEFEKLLMSKAFNELDRQEHDAVIAFVCREEYESMRLLLTGVMTEIKSDAASAPLPAGGSDEVWEKFTIGQSKHIRTTKPRNWLTFKIPLWAASLAASVLLAAVILFRQPLEVNIQKASGPNKIIASFNIKNNDTVWTEKTIYIPKYMAGSEPLPDREPAGTGPQPVYIPSPGIVQDYNTSKAGTNASELGVKTTLTVSIP